MHLKYEAILATQMLIETYGNEFQMLARNDAFFTTPEIAKQFSGSQGLTKITNTRKTFYIRPVKDPQQHDYVKVWF